VNCSCSPAIISVGPITIESPAFQPSALATIIVLSPLLIGANNLVQIVFGFDPNNYNVPVTTIALLAGST